MNKIYIFIFLIYMPFLVNAQCNFEIINFKGQKLNATLKEVFVLDEKEKVLGANYLLFSLFTDGSSKKVLTTFSQVSKKKLDQLCFTSKSKLIFTLKDNTALVVDYKGDDLCETQKKHPSLKQFNTLKIEGDFVINSSTVNELKLKKIKRIALVVNDDLNFAYDVKKKISDSNLAYPTYPSTYFIRNLACLE